MHVVVSARQGDSDILDIPQWHMVASESPRNYLISVPSSLPLAKGIEKSQSFVVNLFRSRADAMLAAGGLGITQAASSVPSAKVLGAQGYLECELLQSLESGESTLFLGRVVALSDWASFSTRES